MAAKQNPSTSNRSALKDFLASIATISGDLSNITAPAFVLDTKSSTEIPRFFAENPAIFVSPATSEDPAYRALLILRSFLSGIRSQLYLGHDQTEGLKKPLNAFLGELFIARWEDDQGLTQMVSEQVSHHPPITACRIWNEKHGVVAETYNQISISFSTSVHVNSNGLVLKSLREYDEHYLLPIPDFKVTNILSTPSPELTGKYYISSTNGYMSVVEFSEKGLLGRSSDKHNVKAAVYAEKDGEDEPLYTVEGSWFDKFVVYDKVQDKILETFDVEGQATAAGPQLIVDSLARQDPWESRRAWNTTIEALNQGDMKKASESKNSLEQGQRQMREDEGNKARTWQPMFFTPQAHNTLLEQLKTKIPGNIAEKTGLETETGWTFNQEAWTSAKKPYHGDLKPDNSTIDYHGEEGVEGGTHPQFHDGVEHRIGAVDAARPTPDVIDGTKIDVGQQPEKKHIEGIAKDQPAPQVAQTGTREEYVGSGIEGMTLEEKRDTEDMLRDVYTSSPKRRQQ